MDYKRESPRWKVWPVIFLAVGLLVLWIIFKLAVNVLMIAVALAVVLLIAGVFQRFTYHLRHGKPRLRG